MYNIRYTKHKVNRFSFDIADNLPHPYVNLPLQNGLLNTFILCMPKLNSYRSLSTHNYVIGPCVYIKHTKPFKIPLSGHLLTKYFLSIHSIKCIPI